MFKVEEENVLGAGGQAKEKEKGRQTVRSLARGGLSFQV